MINVILGVLVRIFSNSYLNVFQKMLTELGMRSSVINFYSYFGLCLVSIFLAKSFNIESVNLSDFLTMGVLGALGNYFIIKSLSKGELSAIAPINSYKPIVALIAGVIFINEVPSWSDVLGIALIILGTIFFVQKSNTKFSAYFYRFLALIFSGSEAVFIKKIILSSNIETAFILWAISGFIFSAFLIINKPLKINKSEIKYQLMLVLSIAVMQYSTNYVFSKINVASALALFQLSTLVSVLLGVKLFGEKHLVPKLLTAFLMLLGAIIIILY